MHHITVDNTECSKCSSRNYERFSRPHGSSGVRCLACGHTVYDQPKTYSVGGSASWTFDPNKKRTF